MIEGDKVRLVALSENYLPNYRKWMEDPEVTDFLASVDFPISCAEEREWLERANSQDSRDLHLTIVTKQGKPIGNIALMDLHCLNRNAQLGIEIGEKEYLGKGFGEDSIRALLAFAFGAMGLNRVELKLNEGNERALACYKKCGFKLEGRRKQQLFYRGKYCDELIMGIVSEDWRRAEKKRKA